MVNITSPLGRMRFTIARWIESFKQIPAIERLEHAVRTNEPVAPSGNPVIFFNASTRILGMSLNGAFSLLASWGLRLAGENVQYLVCRSGMPLCVLGTLVDNPYRKPPCRSCTYFSDNTLPKVHRTDFNFDNTRFDEFSRVLSELNIHDLLKVEWDGIPIGSLCVPSVRWALRRYHLVDDDPTRFVIRSYLLGAANVAVLINDLISREQPQAFVLFNGQSYPEAVSKYVADQRGVNTVTHEVGSRPFSAFFTHGEATSYRFTIPDTFELDTHREAILDSYLSRRLSGDFSMAGIRFWPEMKSLAPELDRRLSKYKQLVSVFTNVVFDTSQIHAISYFASMFDWLDAIAEVTYRFPETLFVFRAHPDEFRSGKESHESVAEHLSMLGVHERENVWFIPSNEYLSSYDLIRKSKFILIYNSTIGLEASILGVPVLSGGRSRYTDYPIVCFPTQRIDFETKLDDWLRNEISWPCKEAGLHAKRFLYYQLYRTSLDFSRFLDRAPGFPGQVRFKTFPVMELHPDQCKETEVLRRGIVEGESFHYLEDHGVESV